MSAKLLSLTLFSVSYCVIQLAMAKEFIAPRSSPVVSASTAAIKLESVLNENGNKSKSYIDRMWLISSDEERLWVVSVATPEYGFSFYKVTMEETVSKLEGDQRKSLLKKIFKN